MKAFISIAFLALFLPVFDKSELSREWVLKKGWFGDEEIVFEKLDTNTAKDLAQVIRFDSSGTVSEYLYNPKKYGLCGNGMLYFEKSEWLLKEDKIIFDIKGGRFAESKFHYKIIYAIDSLSATKLVLKKKKVLLAEVKQF